MSLRNSSDVTCDPLRAGLAGVLWKRRIEADGHSVGGGVVDGDLLELFCARAAVDSMPFMDE